MQGLSKTSTNSSWASRALDRRNANKPRYHVDGLPTFKSSQTPSTSTLQSTIDKAKPSRFNLLHPIRTETSSLSRSTTREQGPASAAPTDTYTGTSSIEDRRGSYGFLNPKYHSRNGPAQANGRLAAVPDGRALTQDGNLSVHPLRASSSRGTSASPSRAQLLDGHRHWSISDPSSLARQRSRSAAGGRSTSRTSHPLHPSANVVSKVEMERVRALLLCTGIKALTMSYRASEVRPPEQLHPLLHAVSRNTGKPLVPVARKQEHILAARMLVDDFDGSVEGLRGLADEFSARRAAELAGALERLKEVARDELTERSRALGDEAAGIAIHVTTKGTRDVQTLSEAAQAVARARRRRMRWVRRMGWGMVEWMLLGIMWWVWLVVMVVRVVLRVFGGVGYAVKWLLFL
ncbi:MAG: hypothetical protein INR71_06010 [Terriglobus roseus]|nr:hypothetical protein [Terriglobus roseus]